MSRTSRCTSPVPATTPPADSRLGIFLGCAFALTWGTWGPLAALVPPGATPLSQARFAALYVLGGLAPALAALVAVALTPRAGSLREYARRLLRWRLSLVWYLIALCGPPLIAWALAQLGLLAHAAPPSLLPLSRALTLFPLMIIGGGLEELGWRGVAQPALQRRWPLLGACLVVGALWALWHLPLFFLHGTAQYGGSFTRFAAGVCANALLLGWLYARTNSILLCVLAHAASNTASASGLELADAAGGLLWLAAALKIVLGGALILWGPPRARTAEG